MNFDKINNYINSVMSIVSGVHSDYYKWIKDNISEIEMNKISELPEDNFLRNFIDSEGTHVVKQCYSNSGEISTRLGMTLGVTYCEGFFLVPGIDLPFEHAWIKYDNKYYDPTLEYNFLESDGYGLVREFSLKEIIDLQMSTHTWGPWLFNKYTDIKYERTH